MEALFGNVINIQWQQVVMWAIGALLIYLAIKKQMEPSLLLPIGFGTILVNLPLSGAVTQVYETGTEEGILDVLFNAGIANEMFPLLLFIGIGAMIDFTPLLSNPKLMIFGAAAQFGIFFTLCLATALGFEIKDAASIAIIGAADGPHFHLCGQLLPVQLPGRHHRGGILVYGAGAHHPAAGHPPGHHQERAQDPHEVCGEKRLQDH